MIAHMETLCCTAKYRKLFGLPDDLAAVSTSTSALGPWYAHVLNIGSARMLHYMSSTSLLSVVIWQRERKTAEERFVNSLRELLEYLRVAPKLIDAELGELATLRYARATDRSVLGSMRDQGNLASYQLEDDPTPADLSARLARTPCGPRNYESPQTLAPRLITAKWG
jgi:hypothetical protein